MIKLATVVVLACASYMPAQSQPIVPIERSSDTIPTYTNPFSSGRFDWQQGQASSASRVFPIKSMIVPGIMVAYGFTALNSRSLKNFNSKVKEEIWTESPHKKTGIDNYLLFAPAVSVYALNAMGIHGKNNFKDRTILYIMSNLIANGAVFSLKSWTHQLRPDGSAYNSFPSGHTAEAFASAEFMRQEYKDVSPWYGVAGYAMATATGVLRMYNNKHWCSDVITGAGIGMASTKIAYWLYPIIKHSLWKDKQPGVVVMPTYQSGTFGVSLAKVF